MIAFFANMFGYILNFLYSFIQNYGIAIILFTILIRIILIPLTYKQQVTMRKTAKIQEKLKKIQEKYKNNPEKFNQETIELYKKENMSPFSGCFSAIVQIILILSVFYMVSSPLTYMKKVDTEVINQYKNEIKLEQGEGQSSYYPEISIIKEKGSTDEQVYLNMEFLGLDLSSVPTANLSDWRVYIIPALYVISSIISMKISTSMTKKKEDDNKEKSESTEMETMERMNKNMMLFMPVMSVIISFIAPLGLALYWLMNNVLMILERVIITKHLDAKEDTKNV